MQQVSAKSMAATAVVIDPRRLPVHLASPRNPAAAVMRKRAPGALINARHLWVLHKRIFLRVIVALVCLSALVGVYEVRGTLGAGAVVLGDLVRGKFADAGFAIENIRITGQSLAQEQDIFAALGLEPKSSTLGFDAEAARGRLEALPAIASATVRKIYPGDVIVTLTEKLPIARWRVDGVTFLIDAKGDQIGEDAGAYGELPLVIGDGAADDALIMIHALERFPTLQSGLAALSRIGARRWDMIYTNGLRVQLPETGVAQALVQLDTYQRDYQLLDRDVTLIDLRVPGLVALKPAVRETDKPGAEKKPT